MKNFLLTGLSVVVILTLAVLGVVFSDYALSQNQMDTLFILIIVCLSSAAYCFIVGEIANNYSQMDKLWSILPIAYTWIIAVRGGFNLRLVVFAIIVTLWGIRLTFNFARKGAYSLKFWSGVEDYRWSIVKNNSILKNRLLWMLFDLFFISLYQNALVLAICLPALAAMESTAPFNYIDIIATVFALSFLILETVADEQQWAFHQTKKKYLSANSSLEDLPKPYDLGFNTLGLWARFRHPNYLGEQGVWVSLYVFAIGAGATNFGVFNWSIVGSMLLVLLFIGSSTLGESISSQKYPKYKDYIDQVHKYLPLKKFKSES